MGTDAREQGADAADATLDELFDHAERVKLIEWSTFSGAKVSVLLLATVAVVAFVTGLSDLSQGAVSLDGPLGGLFPGTSDLLRLYGVFFAFLLGVLAAGLQRRLKIAMYGAFVAVPLLALLPLFTAEATDLPVLLGSLLALPHLVRNREHFDRAVDLSPFQTAALAAFLVVQVYGTVGAYALRESFTSVSTVTDALYYIVVTGTTVGYGDVTPTTELTKLFTLSVIVLGTGSFTIASGSLLIPALESRISSAFGNMSASELSLLEDHVLVLGYGDITEPLLDELDGTTDIVVVTENTDTASALRDREFNVLTADPTDAGSLRDARIDAADGVVVATEDDAHDVLAILAARQANPDIRIVAAAADQKHVEKLRSVGADEVISPIVIGGRMLGRAVVDADAPVGDTSTDGTDDSMGTSEESDAGDDDQPNGEPPDGPR